MDKKKIHCRKKRCNSMGKVLYLSKPTKETASFYDMVFDKQKRQETYDYYDKIYEETEDEKEIFRIMSSKRRRK